MITPHISLIAFYASRVILGILLLLSSLSIAFFIERMLFFRKHLLKTDEIFPELDHARTTADIAAVLKRHNSDETGVILKSLNQPRLTDRGFTHKLSACFLPEKQQWNRHVNFLGSVGSNAPFIGLLGTVLGILKSFADLAVASGRGPHVVMAGISEALIATAVGLVVAIPAVVFYNICKTRIQTGSVRLESLKDLILSKQLFGGQER